MDDAVKKSPLDYRSILENAAVGIFRVTRDGNLLDANDAMARIFGFENREQLLVAAQAHYQWFEQPELGKALFRQLGSATGRTSHETEMLGRNGQPIAVSISVAPADRNSAVFEGAIIDISARRRIEEALHQSELNYRALVDYSQNGIYVCNGDQILYANPAFANNLGYRVDQLVGMQIGDLLVEQDRARQRQMIVDARATRKPAAAILRMKTCGSQDVRILSVKVGRILHGGSDVFLATTFDLTEARRAEDALRSYALRLRALSRQTLAVQENERRHLARELHDEVGQQLTMVKIGLESLLAIDTRSTMTVIENTINTVSDIMQMIRSISLDLRPSMLDDLGLAAALRWFAGKTSVAAGIALDLAIADDLPRLPGEVETAFFRIAQEAITNTVRHAEARNISVVLRRQDCDIELLVADDGLGFPLQDMQQRIQRGEKAGLLGMQERADLIGGTLRLESAPGSGTRVILQYPWFAASETVT